MPLFFLRHIKTYNNIQEAISGRSEVLTMPNQIIQIPNDCKKFDVIYSSTAKRCQDTIKLIPTESICDLIYTEALLERDVGILESLPKHDAIKQYPHLFINGRINVDVLIPKGESIDDVVERVKPFVKIVMENKNSQYYLFCSHNQVLKIIYALIKKISITNHYWKQIDFEQGVVTKID